jgi:hypothetical protein
VQYRSPYVLAVLEEGVQVAEPLVPTMADQAGVVLQQRGGPHIQVPRRLKEGFQKLYMDITFTPSLKCKHFFRERWNTRHTHTHTHTHLDGMFEQLFFESHIVFEVSAL